MERARRESAAGRGTEENTEQVSHPWDTLATITAFDQGNNEKLTLCLNSTNEDKSNKEITTIKSQELQITQTVLIESLLQQLCTILEGDKVRRKKLYHVICKKLSDLHLINDTYNTIEFEVLREKYQRAFYQMFSIAHGEHCPERESVLFIPKFLVPTLRYDKEFHEISFIARGGFGEVYKAQHRLDGIEYAIKKINMPADSIEIIQKQLVEVRALAKLNHNNIVSYNAAWIESSSCNSSVPSTDHKSYRSHTSKLYRKESKSNNLIIDLFGNKNSSNLNNTKVCHESNILLDNKIPSTTDMYTDIKTKKRNKINENVDDSNTISKRFKELNSSIEIIEEKIEKSNNEKHTEESSLDIVFAKSKSNESIVTITDTSSSSHEESYSREVYMYTNDKNRPHVTLYIQMALCEQTLEQWLRGRINVTPEPIGKAIFQQILCGVDYMHSQNIVHHDLKPSNIFISTSGQLQIQLGDFGLACPQIGTHHSVVGTRMYAAPEQLQGKCDPKSDIYSIGIVLIELLISIKTQMELSSIISSLKNGKIPEVLKQHKWAQMVKQLVQEDPAERPSTSQLLKDFNNDKDVIINGLKDTIVNLENDNHIKDNRIQELQEEIVLLKEEIQKLSIQPTGNT